MLKISKNVSFLKNIFWKKRESDRILGNRSFVKMKSTELINYSTNMCQSGQGTTVLLIGYSANYLLLCVHAGITEPQ
jgi:hypothetical protein